MWPRATLNMCHVYHVYYKKKEESELAIHLCNCEQLLNTVTLVLTWHAIWCDTMRYARYNYETPRARQGNTIMKHHARESAIASCVPIHFSRTYDFTFSCYCIEKKSAPRGVLRGCLCGWVSFGGHTHRHIHAYVSSYVRVWVAYVHVAMELCIYTLSTCMDVGLRMHTNAWMA